MILGTIFTVQANDVHAEDIQVTDLGTYGETFPIQEKSLLEVIKAKLQALFESGKLEDHQKIILKTAKEQLNRPAPVRDLVKTTTPKSFIYDPSITVPYDLKDSEGQVFHHKGTKVNPLETHSLRSSLLFVDGDDSEQVAWAIREHKTSEPFRKPKIILVQGAPFDLEKKLHLPIYFDQSGVLVKKLGINQVPARVSQTGKKLLVEEVNAGSER
jgi:conjugal transfer pilus assembly protein TraW